MARQPTAPILQARAHHARNGQGPRPGRKLGDRRPWLTETLNQLGNEGDRLLRLVVVARVGREALLDRRTDDLGLPMS